MAPYNHQSLQEEHGIKPLSTILIKNVAKYLPLATFVYNTFNTPNFSPYKFVFDINLQLLLYLNTTPNIKVSGTFKDYYYLLHKRLQYLHRMLQNKNRNFFQYNSGDLVYIISPIMSQLCTTSRKVIIKCICPVVIYKVIDLHNYLLIMWDGKILWGLFEHQRLMLYKILLV